MEGDHHRDIEEHQPEYPAESTHRDAPPLRPGKCQKEIDPECHHAEDDFPVEDKAENLQQEEARRERIKAHTIRIVEPQKGENGKTGNKPAEISRAQPDLPARPLLRKLLIERRKQVVQHDRRPCKKRQHDKERNRDRYRTFLEGLVCHRQIAPENDHLQDDEGDPERQMYCRS